MKAGMHLSNSIRMTAIVVEESGHKREVLRKALIELGFQVIEASSGEIALAVICRNPTRLDLAILDMNSPIIDGKKVVNTLKRFNPWLNAFLCTSCSTGACDDCSVQGMTCLHEPISRKTLQDALNKAFENTLFEPSLG